MWEWVGHIGCRNLIGATSSWLRENGACKRCHWTGRLGHLQKSIWLPDRGGGRMNGGHFTSPMIPIRPQYSTYSPHFHMGRRPPPPRHPLDIADVTSSATTSKDLDLQDLKRGPSSCAIHMLTADGICFGITLRYYL